MRAFSGAQRKSLYNSSEGKCQSCGKPLPENWHADHIIPFSKGGETHLANGQALCPSCNLSKSNTMKVKRKTFEPRDWQINCFMDYKAKNKKVYSIGAVPGAGKSKGAAMICSELLDDGLIDFLFIISPQENKKPEWREDFLVYFGVPLQIDYSSDTKIKKKLFKGAVMTYAGLNESTAKEINKFCKKHKVAVVFDEIYHLSESGHSAWGTYAQFAFSNAERLISLSGTFWREDKMKIPFLELGPKGYNIDFIYSYADSINDGNSRKIQFSFYDPKIDIKGKYSYNGLLSEIEKEKQLNLAYRALVSDKSIDLADVIHHAYSKLQEIRRADMPNAGMILFAPDKRTAYLLKSWLESPQFNIESTVVTSEDQASSKEIQRFKDSDEECIIAVNMISEGVDIPRLRVGVYLSIYKTYLYFMQSIVGRTIRVTQDEYKLSQTTKSVNYSYAYILEHPALKSYSEQVLEEIELADIEIEIQKSIEESDLDIYSDPREKNQIDIDLTIEDLDKITHISDGIQHSQEAIDIVESMLAASNTSLPPDDKVRMIQAFMEKFKVPDRAPNQTDSFCDDPAAIIKSFYKRIHRIKGKIAGIVIGRGYLSVQDEVFRRVGYHVHSKFGPVGQKHDNDIDTLKKVESYLNDLFFDLRDENNLEAFSKTL